jgi:hypothetical protein
MRSRERTPAPVAIATCAAVAGVEKDDGRVDLVPGSKGEPMIPEVELTEPSLFLEFSGGGVERLADWIANALADT